MLLAIAATLCQGEHRKQDFERKHHVKNYIVHHPSQRINAHHKDPQAHHKSHRNHVHVEYGQPLRARRSHGVEDHVLDGVQEHHGSHHSSHGSHGNHKTHGSDITHGNHWQHRAMSSHGHKYKGHMSGHSHGSHGIHGGHGPHAGRKH